MNARCLAVFLQGLRGRELSWADRPRHRRCHACGIGTLIGAVIAGVVATIFCAGMVFQMMRCGC